MSRIIKLSLNNFYLFYEIYYIFEFFALFSSNWENRLMLIFPFISQPMEECSIFGLV